MSKDATKTDPRRSPVGLPAWLRFILSLLFAAHLLGVFIAPLNSAISVARGLAERGQTPPDSEQLPPRGARLTPNGQRADGEPRIVYGQSETLPPGVLRGGPETLPLGESAPGSDDQSQSLTLYELYLPYLKILYLDHGYGFFSPDPGPSHLIRYTIEQQDGSEIKGVFPNHGQRPELRRQWPRLRYHRYFMLAEQIVASPDDPSYHSGATYAQHLLKEFKGKRITLERIEHRQPTREEFLAGMALDDPSTYRVLATITRDAPPEPQPEGTP